MPFLWNYLINNLLKSRPSPKRKNQFLYSSFIERALSLISRKKQVAAGMTVEAAVILPLFLFFFVNLGSAIEMVRLHGNLQLALWNVGNRLCVYGAVSDMGDTAGSDNGGSAKRGLPDEFKDVVITYAYVKNEIVRYVGEDYLDSSPLSNGVKGLQFWESDLRSDPVDGDVVDIVMTYQTAPWMDIPFVKPFRMSNRYYGRMWTGFDPLSGIADTQGQDMVYVTDNRSVYHESLSCTHLKLSIQEVAKKDVGKLRNQNGSKYKMCSKCGKYGYHGTLYICDEGDYYHYIKDCPGLTRTIYSISRKKAEQEGLKPCSRCGRK